MRESTHNNIRTGSLKKKGRSIHSRALSFLLILTLVLANGTYVRASDIDENTAGSPSVQQEVFLDETEAVGNSATEQEEFEPDAAKLQAVIDSLPDVAAEGFSVTGNNIEDLKGQLTTVSDAIDAFVQSGGNDTQLDTRRLDALTAAVAAYQPVNEDAQGAATVAGEGNSEENELEPVSNTPFEDIITEDYFPDANFRQAVIEECNIQFVGQDLSGKTAEEILGMLDVWDEMIVEGVTDLRGIQYLSYVASVMPRRSLLQSCGQTEEWKTKVPGGASANLIGCPIHILPNNLYDINFSRVNVGSAVRLPNDLYNKMQAVYVRDGSAKTACVKTGLYHENGSDLSVRRAREKTTDNNPNPKEGSGLSMTDDKTRAGDGTGLNPGNYTVNDDSVVVSSMEHEGTVSIDASFQEVLGVYTGESNPNTQRSSLQYHYNLTADYYSTIKLKEENTVLGGLTFTKCDVNEKPLSGAKYQLYNADGTIAEEAEVKENGTIEWGAVPERTTDENGEIVYSNLPTGNYYLKETKAPEGYKLNEEHVDVTVNPKKPVSSLEGGEGKELTVTNDNATFTAPEIWGFEALRSNMGQVMSTADQTDKKAKEDYDADLFIKNQGNSVSVTTNQSNQDKFEELFAPAYRVTMGGKELAQYEKVEDAADYVSQNIITPGIMEEVDDNVEIVREKAVYLDKESIANTEVSQKNETLPVYVQLDASKIFDGGDLTEFSFSLTGEAEDGQPINETITCQAGDGKTGYIVFSPLKFTKEGEYTLEMKEIVTPEMEAANPEVTYDKTVHTITISVKKDVNGYQGLTAAVSGTDLRSIDTTNDDTENTIKNVTEVMGDELIQGAAGVTAAEFVNAKGPKITKTSDQDGKTLKKGDEIKYTLTVENALSKPAEVTVWDNLPSQVKAVSWTLDGAAQNTDWDSNQGVELTIPAKKDKENGKAVIVITCEVTADFSAEDSKSNVITNQAVMECNKIITKTDVHTSFLEPKVSYEMEKVRETSAPGLGTTGWYGFAHGDKVTYLAYIKNTGELPLTMDVTDTFADEAYFSAPSFINVESMDGEGVTNHTAVMPAEQINVTIDPGKTAKVIIEADVDSSAPFYLAPHADDSKADNQDGYVNTVVTANAVSAEYKKILSVTYVKDGDKDTTEIAEVVVDETARFTGKDADSEIGDRSDTANTPVRPNVSYIMNKKRITEAKQFGNSGLYGFDKDDEVVYQVEITNTGELPLTMDVKDAFTEDSYFSAPTFTKAEGEGVTVNNTLPSINKADITIEAGKTAVVTITAIVRTNQYLLASGAEDDRSDAGDGYVNTASVWNVTAVMDDGRVLNEDSNITDSEGRNELRVKYDKANTPVRPTVSYTMEKYRVTPAQQLGNTGKYGFVAGDTVTYQVKIQNGGSLPLTMDVTDAYTDPRIPEGTAYFTDLTYTEVTGEGVTLNNSLPSAEKANITIEAGKEAVVTVTAKVATDVYALSDAAADDGKGYENTAAVRGVTGVYTDKDGNQQIIDQTFNNEEGKAPLGDQTDTANTPVRPRVSYTMDKKRITEAGPFGNSNTYGFKKNDEVEYQVEITNTGELPLTMDVTDVFENPDYFTAPSYVKAEGEGVTVNSTLPSNEKVNLMIDAGRTAVVTVTAAVQTDAYLLAPHAADDKSNAEDGYLNTATVCNVTAQTEDGLILNEDSGITDENGSNELSAKTDTANTPVQPAPSYTMEKRRITQASQFTDGNYGLKKGETAEYQVIVTNTGNLDLTMQVNDEFAEPENFSAPVYKSVEGENVTWNNRPAQGGTKEAPQITVKAGASAVITIAATVLTDIANFSAEELDDGKGYQNTASVKDAEGTYIYDEDGKEQTKKVNKDSGLTDENGENPLRDKEDTANTPVRPSVSYTMGKVRITEAGELGNTKKYGFVAGETVTYQVKIQNTGSLPLTMDVTDAYTDPRIPEGMDYFTDLTYTEAAGQGVTVNNVLPSAEKANITIEAGKEAVVTVTAKVATDVYVLSDAAADDGKGYENTATVSGVTAAYTDKDGSPQTIDQSYIDEEGRRPLEDQTDIANTPVRPQVSYTMNKKRITEAAQFGSSNTYGFVKGDEVEYQVEITNTGELPLNMDVKDVFENPDYFTAPSYVKAEGEGVTVNNSLPSTEKVSLTIDAGKTAVVTITATVQTSQYLLASSAEDDRSDAGDGYVNTASVWNVTAVMDDGTILNEDSNITDSEGRNELRVKYDKANTPVRPTVSYTMEKYRVTPAQQLGNTGKYGFVAGDTVTYQVKIQNGGSLPLTMDVTDAYTDPRIPEGAAYFTDLTYTEVTGEGVTLNNSLPSAEKANITIQAGKEAVVTVTAKVATEVYALSDAADDDGKGYENTAAVRGVTAVYTDKDGNQHVIDQTFTNEVGQTPLGDQTDTANTPVRPRVSYTMDKKRITEAGAFGSSNTYGFVKGDEVEYRVEITNTGELPLNMDVTDVFENPDYFTAPSYVKAEGEGVTVNNSLPSNEKVNLTIDAGGTAIVTVKAAVQTDKYLLAPYAADDKSNAEDGYLNTATVRNVTAQTEDGLILNEDSGITDDNGSNELSAKTDTANTPVRPAPSYTMEKRRITEASQFTDGNYGLKKGETAEYQVIVTNTGNLDLTMQVNDEFAEPENFSAPVYKSVEGENVTWNNRPAQDGTKEAPQITVKAGASAVITIAATVLTDIANFSAEELDDGKGYQNTASVKDAEGTYTYRDENGKEQTKEVNKESGLTDENGENPLRDKEDTANTPVRPSVSYTMEKIRVTEADEFENTKKYGFVSGDTVTYQVKIQNTGSLPLTMDVTDAYTDPRIPEGMDYFTDLTYTEAAGEGVTVNNTLPSEKKANITIEAGKEAVVTVTAKVATDSYTLSDAAADDGKGYENTVTVSGVTAAYTDKDGSPQTIDQSYIDEEGRRPLEDQTDIANTPVRPQVSYTMNKKRITEAAQFGSSNTYGFVKGDEVEYQVEITNTGELPLNMDVTDVFENPDYFTAPSYVKAEGEGVTVNNSLPATEKVNLTIEAGKTAVVTITATVLTDTYFLSQTAMDNEDNENDGYVNTAAVSHVSTEYIDENETAQVVEDVLEDQEDTANTPVRPVVSYTMEKHRITKAGAAGDKYGFAKGDVVTYQVTVKNTGTLALTMDVTDTFTDSAYFTTPNYTKVEGEGVTLNNTLPSTEKANITIAPGKTAIVTMTAKVLTNTEYLASKSDDEKADPKDGYVNTAKVSDVTGEYIIQDDDGNDITNTIDKNSHSELKDKTDTANTPVRAASDAAKTDPKGNNTAKTGDQANLYFWLLLLCAAGAEITVLLRKKNLLIKK